MKKDYVKPEIEIEDFVSEDIITESTAINIDFSSEAKKTYYY